MRCHKLFIFFLTQLTLISVSSSAEVVFSSFLTNLPSASVHDVIIQLHHSDYDDIVSNSPVATNDVDRNEYIQKLQKAASSSQSPIHDVLGEAGFTKEARTSHWISNVIVVEKADVTLLQTTLMKATKFTGSRIEVNEPTIVKAFPIASDEVPVSSLENSNASVSAQLRAGQWGVEKIQADRVWLTGNTGKNIIVGISDTGVNFNHIALKNNYGGAFLDSFNLAYTGIPFDGNGHGTHCAGTVLGQTNGIGVAPGATWIACRGLDNSGSGSNTNLLTCGAFMACPKKDASGTCSGFPDIVSNSWGGGKNNPFYNGVIANWQKLSITPVFAIGNVGPNCDTTNSPGDQPNLISVGATDINDNLASFSSRGVKTTVMPQNPKPQLSAPGVKIISADFSNVNGYVVHDGTSMATPHVAGTIALMKSKNRKITFEQISRILNLSTFKGVLVNDNTKYCISCTVGNSCPLIYPNPAVGWGRISALQAVALVPPSTNL